MIVAYMENRLAVVGITRKNVERLTDSEPMTFELLRPVQAVAVFFGETKPETLAAIEQRTGIKFEAAHWQAAREDPS